jgi:hypothetical protein
MLKIIEDKVRNHPYKDLDELREFIDQLLEKWIAEDKGRNTDTQRTAYAHRSSV